VHSATTGKALILDNGGGTKTSSDKQIHLTPPDIIYPQGSKALVLPLGADIGAVMAAGTSRLRRFGCCRQLRACRAKKLRVQASRATSRPHEGRRRAQALQLRQVVDSRINGIHVRKSQQGSCLTCSIYR